MHEPVLDYREGHGPYYENTRRDSKAQAAYAGSWRMNRAIVESLSLALIHKKPDTPPSFLLQFPSHRNLPKRHRPHLPRDLLHSLAYLTLGMEGVIHMRNNNTDMLPYLLPPAPSFVSILDIELLPFQN